MAEEEQERHRGECRRMENKWNEGEKGIDPGGDQLRPQELFIQGPRAMVCPNPGPCLAFSQELEDMEVGIGLTLPYGKKLIPFPCRWRGCEAVQLSSLPVTPGVCRP